MKELQCQQTFEELPLKNKNILPKYYKAEGGWSDWGGVLLPGSLRRAQPFPESALRPVPPLRLSRTLEPPPPTWALSSACQFPASPETLLLSPASPLPFLLLSLESPGSHCPAAPVTGGDHTPRQRHGPDSANSFSGASSGAVGRGSWGLWRRGRSEGRSGSLSPSQRVESERGEGIGSWGRRRTGHYHRKLKGLNSWCGAWVARKRVEIHGGARPCWGLKASLSSLPGWQGLRMINPSTPRFYSVHSFGFVEPGTGGIVRWWWSPAFLPEQEFASPKPGLGCQLLIARSLAFPFSPIVPAPRSCGAGGLGRSKHFSFLPLRLSEGKAPSPGVGERQQLLSCLAQGSRNREGH